MIGKTDMKQNYLSCVFQNAICSQQRLLFIAIITDENFIFETV